MAMANIMMNQPIIDTSTKVADLKEPLGIGAQVRFSIWMKPLRMVAGKVIEVITEGEEPENWYYRVQYDFKEHQGITDLVDHTDPTLYLVEYR